MEAKITTFITKKRGTAWWPPHAKPQPLEEDRVRKTLLCVKCGTMLFKPLQLSCGHRICVPCCGELLSPDGTEVKCPTETGEEECETTVFVFHEDGSIKTGPFVDNTARKELMNLQVRCLNVGCSAIAQWKTLQLHLDNCEHAAMQCDNLECGEQYLRRDQELHEKTCESAPQSCPHCQEVLPRKRLQAHLQEACIEVINTCACGEKVRRRDGLEHKKTCTNAPKPCSFNLLGCGFEGTPAALEDHAKADVYKHAEQLKEKFKTSLFRYGEAFEDETQTGKKILHERMNNIELQALELHRVVMDRLENSAECSSDVKELRQKVSLLEQTVQAGLKNRQEGGAAQQEETLPQIRAKLDKLERRLEFTEAVTYDGRFIWKVSEYSRLKTEFMREGAPDSVYSPPFYSDRHGYKLCARLFPMGVDKGGSHLTIYIVLMPGEHDNLLKWPFQLQIKISLLDVTRSGHDITCTIDPRVITSEAFKKPDRSKGFVGYGPTKFVSISTLEASNRYRDNDAFYVKIELDTTKYKKL